MIWLIGRLGGEAGRGLGPENSRKRKNGNLLNVLPPPPATEQHQELEHSIATLKGEKSHVENQLKILQQKNEIMVEMYQQKENALQQ